MEVVIVLSGHAYLIWMPSMWTNHVGVCNNEVLQLLKTSIAI